VPESELSKRKRLVGVVLLGSAAVLALAALLVYTAVIPLPAGTRGLLTAVLGAAAFGDVLVGLWFIRSAQSS
jgi:hypothetical protein